MRNDQIFVLLLVILLPLSGCFDGAVGDAEGTGLEWDFLSNGVKCRTSNGGINGSTNAYIYMAFAEEPLVANVGASIPATAR